MHSPRFQSQPVEGRQVAERRFSFAEQIEKVLDVAVALSRERNLNRLLDQILRGARSLTGAQAGSLYVREKDVLRWEVTQNDGLVSDSGVLRMRKTFGQALLALDRKSIAGHVCLTGELLNIPDVYTISPVEEYRFDPDYDKRTHYRTRSALTVPMKDPFGEVIGALQLINCLQADGAIQSFSPDHERISLAFASQAAVALRNARLSEDLRAAYLDTIFRLSIAAEYRDDDTASHLHRMTNYAVLVAEAMGLPAEEVESIRFASPMHDIGKIGISDAILLKPGKYTPEEFEEMKKHTLIGAKILGNSKVPLMQLSETIALCHHERFDGSGYPRALKGERIPLPARVVSIADVFDALTTRRVYKPAFPVEQALEMIRKERGRHFDPCVVDAFFKAQDKILEVKKSYSK